MQADLQWLTNPAVFQVNRLDAHSDHMCCASAQEAARGETSLRQSLEGLGVDVALPVVVSGEEGAVGGGPLGIGELVA